MRQKNLVSQMDVDILQNFREYVDLVKALTILHVFLKYGTGEGMLSLNLVSLSYSTRNLSNLNCK